MAGIQVNRTLSGVVLPQTLSSSIWQTVQEASVITKLAQRIDMPGTGVTVPLITGDAVADWVAETAEKPVSRPTVGNKTIQPYKLALIVPFSEEFRRDLPTMYRALVRRLPNAIARKFDETVLGYDSSPGSGFDTLAGITEVELTGAADVTTAAEHVTGVEDASINGTALSAQAEFVFASLTDSEGRFLFPDTGAVFNKFGGSVVQSKHVYDAASGTIGVTGDWSRAYWGQVEGISISFSDQATINDSGTAIHLWQRNMVAVRVECEMGFALRDAVAGNTAADYPFVRYTSEGS